MELLYIVLFIIVIILLINNKNQLTSKIEQLEASIIELKLLIKRNNEDKPTVENNRTVADYIVKPTEQIKPPEIINPPRQPAPTLIPSFIERHPEVISDSVINRPVKTADTPLVKRYVQPEPGPSFFERHPDIEKFIGEN
ncbi:MAG: hypothetical protein EOP47_26455 [Sphingobacteriaceae bacterium]|nr:MAG: hypothetical protein EOP47_26455 [Sphingobacteriaceae bacterium]